MTRDKRRRRVRRRKFGRLRTRHALTTHLTRRGWALVLSAAALFAVGYGTGRTAMLYPAALLTALPFMAWIVLIARPPKLQVDRWCSPSIVEVGTPVRITLALSSSRLGMTPPGLGRDALPWSAADSPPLAIPPLGTRGRGPAAAVRLAYTLNPPRRGVVGIGPLSLEFQDPFGLVTRRVGVGDVSRLVITPAVEPLIADAATRSPGAGMARPAPSRFAGDDDHMTREYRRGDPLRRVHWRASARHGELMVRQEEHRGSPAVRIVLETRATAFTDVDDDVDGGSAVAGDSASFEWAVRMVAALSAHLDDRGYRIDVIETGPAQIAAPASASLTVTEVLVGLAAVSLREQERRGMALPRMAPPDAGGGSRSTEPQEHRHARPHERPSGPVFAFLGEVDDGALSILRSIPRLHAPAVAFTFDHRPVAAAALARAGWACVLVRPGTPLAVAWSAVESDAAYA